MLENLPIEILCSLCLYDLLIFNNLVQLCHNTHQLLTTATTFKLLSLHVIKSLIATHQLECIPERSCLNVLPASVRDLGLGNHFLSHSRANTYTLLI